MSDLRVDGLAKRPVWPAIFNGFRKTCPKCGHGSLFGKFLKVNDTCDKCGEDFSEHRADDAPTYLTIFIVGHLVVGLLFPLTYLFALDIWLQIVLLVLAAIGLCMWLIQPTKGAVVGYQWANYMHGFHPDGDLNDPK